MQTPNATMIEQKAGFTSDYSSNKRNWLNKGERVYAYINPPNMRLHPNDKAWIVESLSGDVKLRFGNEFPADCVKLD
jgi:hypothetical protein